MVNVSATCRQYMSASDHVATLEKHGGCLKTCLNKPPL
jgi:hypothetical protein